MKIGILTFHYADNYGAVLQCYALQEALKLFGHKVFIIDYRNSNTESAYKTTPVSHFIRCWLHHFKIEPWMKEQAKKYKKRYLFNKFRKSYLNITTKQYYRNNIPTNYDAYVIGSDQLWNECCTVKFEPIYFGNFTRNINSKLYGYAISANQDTLNSLGEDKLTEISSRFNQLSFREKHFQTQFEVLTNANSRTDLDPTLLHGKQFWDKITNLKYSKLKYVLIYEVITNPSDTNALTKKATEFAKKHNLKVVNALYGTYSINEFVSLFKYATCVFTSSFHATVFSLIFNRPLYAFKLNSVRDERYTNLLTQVNALNAIAEFTDTPLEFPKINYHIVNAKIEEMRQRSIDYLKSM